LWSRPFTLAVVDRLAKHGGQRLFLFEAEAGDAHVAHQFLSIAMRLLADVLLQLGVRVADLRGEGADQAAEFALHVVGGADLYGHPVELRFDGLKGLVDELLALGDALTHDRVNLGLGVGATSGHQTTPGASAV
jgi:hypothetical protein